MILWFGSGQIEPIRDDLRIGFFEGQNHLVFIFGNIGMLPLNHPRLAADNGVQLVTEVLVDVAVRRQNKWARIPRKHEQSVFDMVVCRYFLGETEEFRGITTKTIDKHVDMR